MLDYYLEEIIRALKDDAIPVSESTGNKVNHFNLGEAYCKHVRNVIVTVFFQSLDLTYLSSDI